MVAYTKPQQRKKEESEQLRGERDKIKFTDLRFERWQVVRFRKAPCDMKRLFYLGSFELRTWENKDSMNDEISPGMSSPFAFAGFTSNFDGFDI